MQTVDEILFGNVDVSASVLNTLLINLAANRSFQDALRAEITEQKSQKSYSVTQYIAKQSSLLNYLVMESMRLSPAFCESGLLARSTGWHFPRRVLTSRVHCGRQSHWQIPYPRADSHRNWCPASQHRPHYMGYRWRGISPTALRKHANIAVSVCNDAFWSWRRVWEVSRKACGGRSLQADNFGGHGEVRDQSGEHYRRKRGSVHCNYQFWNWVYESLKCI